LDVSSGHLYGQYVFRNATTSWYSKWEYLFCRYGMFYGATDFEQTLCWNLTTDHRKMTMFVGSSGGLDPKCSKRCRIYWGVFTTAAYCAQKESPDPMLMTMRSFVWLCLTCTLFAPNAL
jgi:hypothetical protein